VELTTTDTRSPPCAYAGAPHYVYDDAGRLLAVIDPTSDTAVYTYDAVGNLLSITRQPSSQLAIFNFTPKRGPIGTVVTIYGTGFSATPSQNTITFNGTAATVTSATTTQLVTTVPGGATTGPIALTTPGGSTTSADAFTVTASGVLAPPTITNFTPTIGAPGTSVTITGANFSSTSSENRIAFNVAQSTATTATTTSLSTLVASGGTSGHIAVATPFGTAVSGDDFFVPPPPYTAADVAYTGRMSIGGPSQVVSIPTATKIGLVVFEGTVGQRLSVNLSNVTIGSGPCCYTQATVTLFEPHGVYVTAVNLPTTGILLEPQTLPATGTYTILIDPVDTKTGSVTLTLYDVPPDVTGTLTSGVTTSPIVITTPGQNARLTFTGSAGQRLSVILNTSTLPCPGGGTLTVLNPDGTELGNGTLVGGGAFCANNFWDALALPVTGTYTLLLDPDKAATGQVTLTPYLFTDLVDTITPSGPSKTATFTIPGQDERFMFSNTAGQKIALFINSSTLGGNCGQSLIVLQRPDGSWSSISACTGYFLNVTTIATAGTSTVLVNPYGSATGNVTLTLYDVPDDQTGTITPGASTMVTITAVGQKALLSFSAAANQKASLRVTASTISAGTVRILQSNGSSLGGTGITANSFLDAITLPATDTYTVEVDPANEKTGQVTLVLYVFDDVTGALTINGGTAPVTTTYPGQNALLTFPATAGQAVTVRITSNTMGGVSVSLLKPDDSVIVTSISSATNFNLPQKTLATDGTYKVKVNPSTTNTGSLNVSVTSP
jgi:YD repeat-containing protein